ncbi:MAG: HEAT repeat domain-containing protein, partial [Isosphaeraceae bacterium]|nr:HEAT repeat domain-containing protein [Isosphaeraceae bacterium]
MRPNAALGIILVFVLTGFSQSLCAAEPVPKVGEGWTIELIAKAPEVLFPTAIVVAPDGTIFVGQDPMDMPGPPTEPIDSIVALHPDGRRTLFADKLWSVMGLEWIDGALYVVHAPFLSVFRDTDGDGRADAREDLMTGLGPKQPGFNGLNDHIASGCRLGMDGFLYIAVGDKGIPRGVGKDGTTIQLHGGGVIRIRPDGTGLEVVSTGERNPLSVALSVADDIFTYGNDDDSKRWPNSLTHHIVGGHYGYPYQFLNAPARCLPILAGQMGGSGAQGICYNEAGLPAQYRGDLFFCDWGLQTVFRFRLEKAGGTFRLKARENFVEKGDLPDFRPFSMAVSPDGTALYLVDWAFNGWLAKGPQTGRIYRLRYEGPDRVAPASRPRPAANGRLDPIQARAQLDDPALSVRLAAQRELARGGAGQARLLIERLRQGEPRTGRLHALWALDAINTPEARQAIRAALHDNEAALRLQAARSAGIRRDREALASLGALLKDADAAIRREAAIALGKMGDPEAGPWLYEALGDPDPFAAWSIRSAIRALKAWDAARLEAALRDPRRRDDALKLADEAWAVPVVDALIAAFSQTGEAAMRERLLTVLAGLYRRYPEWSGHWFGTNPLAGSMPQKTRAWSPEGMSRVLIGLARGLNDPETSVRRRAIAGLRAVGPPAAPHLRERIAREPDPDNLKALAEALGALSDTGSVPALASLVQAPGHPIEVRAAALDALGLIPGPAALRARLALVYEAKAPTELVARALPSLGRTGTLPPNDLLGFLEKPEAAVRSAALLALAMKPPAPARPRGRPPFVRASAASSV